MSTTNTGLRRRLIVELWHGGADIRTLRAAAEVAASLEFDLHGLFVEDTALLSLAELPFVRELRLPTHEWQKVEAERIAVELRQAAAAAQVLLRDVAAALGIANAFEIRRGEPAEALAEVATGGDVIVIAATAAGRHLAPGAARVRMAAHKSGAALLLLSAGLAPHQGAVVAVLGDAADPALALAARAAVHTRERLLLLLPADVAGLADSVVAHAVTLGVPRTRVTMRTTAGRQAEDIMHALGHLHERLIVLTRQSIGEGDLAAAARLAAGRNTPVLAL